MMAVEAVALQERLQLIQQQQIERFKSRKTISIKRDNSENVCPDQKRENETPFSAHNHGADLDSDTILDLRTATQEDRTIENCKSIKSDRGPLYLSKDQSIRGGKAAVVEDEYFKDQVEQLQLDNARLKSELKVRERKVTELEKAREEERAALGVAGSSATQRIVELSKKNRELNAELATEKNRVRQLHKKLKESEKSLTQKEPATDRDSSCNGRQSAHKSLNRHKDDIKVSNCQDDSASVISQLRDQLQQLKMKMAEQRNQCQVLKQELKLAQKVITKEVGEGSSVSALLSGVSGWRGRAQQIIALQNKLAELGEQLRQEKLNNSAHARNNASSVSCDVYLTGPTVDTRQKAALRKIETGKQKNLEEARSELDKLRTEYSQIQQQCNALKARNKTLTSNVKSLKAEITSLTKKQSQNDNLISSLRAESSNSVRSLPDDGNHTPLQDLHREKQILRQENQILRAQLEELQSAKRSTKIKSDSHQVHCTADNKPSPLPPVVSRRGQMSMGQMERKAFSAGQPLCLLHPQKTDLREPSIYMKVTEVERERLLELTKCLQQRLDATTDKFVRLDIDTRTLRQQNARLEKMIGRSRAAGGSGSKAANECEKVDELETQLAIQMDVNAVLKETLELTRHDKLEDVRHYQKMIQETKKLLL